MAEEFTEYSRQNPREDLLRDYIPKNMDKIAQQTDAFLYLFNQDGDCIYASENSGISADDLKLSTEMRSGLQKDGEYMTDSNVGKIDHSAAEPCSPVAERFIWCGTVRKFLIICLPRPTHGSSMCMSHT